MIGRERRQGGAAGIMSNVVLVLAILVGWFVLQRWVLPWMGIPT